jgi:hypothetical protein
MLRTQQDESFIAVNKNFYGEGEIFVFEEIGGISG